MYADEYPDGFGELYNLEEDPWETKNLFFNPDYRDKVNQMRDELLRFRITTTRPVTVMRPLPQREFSTGGGQRVIRYHHFLDADGKTQPREIAKGSSRNNYLRYA